MMGYGRINNTVFGLLGTALLFCTSLAFSQDITSQIKQVQTLRRAAQYSEARELLEAMHRKDPKNIVTYNQLRDILFQLQDWEAALKLIQDRKSRIPSDINPVVDEARVWHRMGEHKKAMKAWLDILHKHPRQSAFVQRIASVMTGERLYEEAIEVYLKGRKRLKKPDQYALNLAHLYSATQQYGKAAGEYLRYMRTRPKQAAYIEGQILRLPKTDSAARKITEAFEKDFKKEKPKASNHRLFWRYLTVAGQYQKAFKEVLAEEALLKTSSRGSALAAFAAETRKLGAPEYSILAYQEILNSVPRYAGLDAVLLGLGHAHRNQANYAEAIDYYDQLVQKKAKSSRAPEALFQKGLIFQEKLRDVQSAAAAFQQLLLRYPKAKQVNQAMLKLGLCYALSGDYVQAEATYRQVMKRNAGSKENDKLSGHYHLARLFYWKGDFDSAVQQLETLNEFAADRKQIQSSIFNDALYLKSFIKTHSQKHEEALKLFASAQLWKQRAQADTAMLRLNTLLLQFPNSSLAGDGLFLRAETRKELQQHEACVQDLDTLVARFPDHILADRALLTAADVLMAEGHREKALLRLETLVVNYPFSLYVDESRARIRNSEKEDS